MSFLAIAVVGVLAVMGGTGRPIALWRPAGRFGTDLPSPGYGLAVTATVVFDAGPEVQPPEVDVVVVSDWVVDDDVDDVVVVESSVVFDVDPVDSVVADDEEEDEVVSVVVCVDPDDGEVVDAPPVVVVDPVCDDVVVGRLVDGLDERLADVVVVVEVAAIDAPLPLRREERTAPEALVVDPERSLSPSSRELTGKSPWSVASTSD
jgi:hypothetical protein